MFVYKYDAKAAENLAHAAFSFVEKTGFNLRVGAEIEWYFVTEPSSELCSALVENISDKNAPRLVLEKERGNNQYEFALDFVDDVLLLAQRICAYRELIKKYALEHDNDVDFCALPYIDQPGSGLHIHVNLWNNSGEFPLAKNPNSDEESDIMLASIAGLLFCLPKSMPVFAPQIADKARYRAGFLAPSKISWGGNNRTVALRIPCSTSNPLSRRIEHRVPSANADPFLVLAEIIKAIELGILHDMRPQFPKIYGDAADSQYGLPNLYQSIFLA